MAGEIKISIDQVAQIATSLEGLNNKLKEQLITSQETISNLTNIWEGDAAQATVEAYNGFASKHFQNYYDVIDSYVKFLRANVVEGYTETETANVTLADAFK